MDLALKEYGRLDIVVHNAAIERLDPLAESHQAGILDHLEPDVLAAVTLSQLAWPVFESQHYGRLVLTSSTAYFGSTRAFPYVLSKAATVSLARSLGQLSEKTDSDIKVNAIAPHGLSRMVDQGYAARPRDLAVRRKHVSSHYTSAVVVSPMKPARPMPSSCNAPRAGYGGYSSGPARDGRTRN